MNLKKYFIALFILCFSSCSSIYNVKPPEIALNDLQINNVTLFQTTALVNLRVDNENDWEISTSGGVYRLYVNGKYLGKALDKTGFSVSRFSSKNKELELTIDNLNFLNQIQPLMKSGSANYKLDAKVFLVEPIRRTLNLSKNGNVNILNHLR